VSDDAARALASLFLSDAARFDDAARKLAKSGQSFDIPIHGQSMGSTLPDGALVRVSFEDGTNVAIGDVVIFREREQLVAHRVICRAAKRRLLLTRGDARISPDVPVAFSRILGRVTGIVGSDGSVTDVPAFRRRGRTTIVDRPLVASMALQLAILPAFARVTARLLTGLERAWKKAKRAL
jgi:signal peptidase I